jgi:hypothetical protein
VLNLEGLVLPNTKLDEIGNLASQKWCDTTIIVLKNSSVARNAKETCSIATRAKGGSSVASSTRRK